MQSNDKVIPFGKYKGVSLKEICSTDIDYLHWLISPAPRGRWSKKYLEFAELMDTIWKTTEYPPINREKSEADRRLIAVTTAILNGENIPESEEDTIGFTSNSSDTGWYFSAKSLIFQWAHIIGSKAFLVHHFIKSQCPERGLKGRPIIWSEAPVVLGINAEEIQSSLDTLKSVGLLRVDEEGCLIVLDPDDAFLDLEKEHRR